MYKNLKPSKLTNHEIMQKEYDSYRNLKNTKLMVSNASFIDQFSKTFI